MARPDNRPGGDVRGFTGSPARLRTPIACVLAVVATLLVTVVARASQDFWGEKTPLMMHMLVIVIVAAAGGLWPALLATLVSVTTSSYFLLAPPGSFVVVHPADQARLAILASVGLVVAVLAERMHRASRELVRRGEARARALGEAVDERTAELESLLTHAPVGFAFLDRDGRFVRVNPWVAAALARPAEAYLGKAVREIAPAYADAVEPLVRRVFDTGEPQERITLASGDAGDERHWLVSFYPVRRADGAVVSVGAVIVEITAQKRVEAALRESEAKFRALFHGNLVPLVLWYIDGRITDANGAFLRLVGYSLEEIQRGDLRWTTFIMPKRAEYLADLVVQYQKTGRFGPEEREYALRDGRCLPVLVGGAALPGRPYEGVAFILDLSELKRAEAALAEQLALTRTLTDNATAALFLVDRRGYCTFMNPAAEAMTGYSLDELRRAPLHEIVRHRHRAGEPAPMDCPVSRAVFEGRRLPPHEDVYARKSGEPFPAICAASPVQRDGETVSTVVELRDITWQKEAEREREALLASERAARAEAERANRQKDEFLAMISHELRTPLNAILGWARLLQRPAAAPEQLGRGLASIERNAQLQTQIISDLLDVGRVVSGKIHLDLAKVDLAAVIEASLDALRGSAQAKGIALDEVVEAARAKVLGDPGRLQQVVWNLVSNAIKFTPRGGRVRVALAPRDGRMELCVSDTGQGIEPEFLPHVFERFRQADASAARRHGGLGLGLAIVKHLVELHGGEVRAESAGPGEGSTFVVTLPIAQGGAGDDAAAYPAECAQLSGARILVVDDEPDGLELARRMLEERGAAVRTATSAREALDVLGEQRPDVLVTDIGMPGMDGYELVRRVRAAFPGPTAALPAVALTAFARPEDRERAFEAGFQAHVTKPVDSSKLVAAVACLLGRGAAASPPP